MRCSSARSPFKAGHLEIATTLSNLGNALLAQKKHAEAEAAFARAEALRRAMVSYIADTSRPRNAYPAFRAPFPIVGEGVLR